MPAGTHELKVGAFRCVVLQEGSRTPEVAGLTDTFPNATSGDISAALQKIGYKSDQMTGSMSPLYIEAGGKHILVDVGFGENAPPGFGNVIPGLQSVGVQPENIDIVYLSHFHGDHINGMTKKDGSPTFPNAHYVTSQTEWNYWMSAETLAEIGEERADSLKNMLIPLKNKFSFVNDGDEVVAGVCVVNTPGHTPGHTGLLLESQGERLLCLVDALHNIVQFTNTIWQHRADVDPALASQTRRTMLQRAVDENLLVLFYHLKFPGLGHVVTLDDAFLWQPID